MPGKKTTWICPHPGCRGTFLWDPRPQDWHVGPPVCRGARPGGRYWTHGSYHVRLNMEEA